MHDPASPFALWNLLGYRIRGVIKRTVGAPSITSTPTCTTGWRRVIGVHVRIVAACTGRPGIIVLGTFAFLLSNTVNTCARVY